jgi:Ca2+-binding EF-hand superfamily protein
MRAMFALMDADGDGTLSREEFAEAHDRIFNHMDADGDGQVTLEEMRAFRMGAAGPAAAAPDAEAEE